MGQAPSVPGLTPELTRRDSTRSGRKAASHVPAAVYSVVKVQSKNRNSTDDTDKFSVSRDYTSDLPEECLAYVFQSLAVVDRKACALVCKRWLKVEGQSRQRLSLNAQSELANALSSLFTRYDNITKLALRCDRRSISVSDDALIEVSLRCRNLTRLKLRGCREVTDLGIAAFAQNCKSLRKLSCGSCVFGAKGLNSVFEHCILLEELSIKRLRGINDNGNEAAEQIGPGLASKSLKSICLKELYNGQVFGPLIIGAKHLKSLKLIKCLGDWDSVLESMANSHNGLVEILLERLQVSDFGLSAISNCPSLEILHIVKTPECTNIGVVSLAERCKLLRKLHIDGWRTNRIGDEGLAAIGKHCANLQELVLIGINPTTSSLEVIASNCRKLERLALCSSETIRDAEISCIAERCSALRKFCIKSCPISDNGLKGLACGCPNLVKIKVKKCKEVTHEIVEWLRTRRGTLVVNLDMDEVEAVDASASDGGGAHEEALEIPIVENQVENGQAPAQPRSTTRSASFKARLNQFVGWNMAAACTLRKWSRGSSSGSGNP